MLKPDAFFNKHKNVESKKVKNGIWYDRISANKMFKRACLRMRIINHLV